jgi:glycosyltransferase involved in cell wall biosynthesis
MKILLLPDYLNNWSGHNRCKAIKKFIPEHQFDIIQGHRNYEEIEKLFPQYDIVHFNYTGGVDKHEEYLQRNDFYKKIIMTIVNERSLLTGDCVDVEKLEDMMRKVAKITSVSEKISKIYHCEYLSNGVDTEFFSPPKNIVVGFIGSEETRKGYFHLKEACQELGLTLKTLIYSKIQIPFEDMPTWYRSIDVLVHPSITEGCSNVILEALAMNIPVITRKTGIWDKLGVYVTLIEYDYNNLCETLKKFNSRNFIQRNFNWKHICRRYKEIYEEI